MAAAACARPTLTSLWLLPASLAKQRPINLDPSGDREASHPSLLTSEDHDGDLDEIVAAAESLSQEASDEERRAMWSVDEGIDISDVRNLRKRVLQRLRGTTARSTPTRRRVIANACLQGFCQIPVRGHHASFTGAGYTVCVGVAIPALAAVLHR